MTQPISFEALTALDAIARCGSFAAAAKSLHKVPSALTYTIKTLEQQLGLSLFDRSKQRAVLTDAGQLVLEQGREILLAAERLQDDLQQLESGWERQLRIARDTVIDSQPLLHLLAQFAELAQPVDIDLSSEVLGGGWDALHSRRTDIAIGVSGELPKGLFHTHPIGQLRYQFVVAADHPLATKSHIEATDLRHYPAVVVADSSQGLPRRDSGLFVSRQTLRVESMATKAECQAMGLGIGFLPEHIAKPYLQSGRLVARPCAVPRPDNTLYIAWRNEPLGKAAQWFIERLRHCQWPELQPSG
ncbi:LysR family transcriptional regulator [Ferrimonas senticii]|uniref:LysR family transcriptional regulator n=1 Tax=Ferrimonas senticii TaxID=394566 RepID=UPI0004019DBF|nr:LysR family transcriptional regulator [Ferrimonas senticii]